MALNRNSSTKSKVETAAGASLAAAPAVANKIAWSTHPRRKVERAAAQARDYLSQGGKAKRDPTKVNLNTQRKKAMLRQLNEANRTLKTMPRSPRFGARQGKFLAPAAAVSAVGAGLAWHGGRQQVKKDFKRKDVDAAALGAGAGVGAYYGAGYGAKRKISRPKIARQSAAERAKVGQYNKTAMPKGGMASGDPRWKGYWRGYPKGIKGSRTVRVLSRTHGGKTGFAVGAATAATGAGASVLARRKVSKSGASSMSAFGVEHG